MHPERSRGTATVEYVALASLIAAIIAASIAILASGEPPGAGRELGAAIGRRLACAPRYPVPCNRNPLALAYGFPIGKLVRFLAPAGSPAAGPGAAGLLPVDYRRCRLPSCALASADPGLSTALRRTTAFTSVEDLRPVGGPVRVSYWLYRPTLGWERILRSGGAAELAAASSSLRLNLEDDPALVPLETLAGRNHARFRLSERPPWQWQVPGL
ncbi:MAG: hypothetical protein EXQ70_06505 [Solirubrobacterales bacterium]|nr:hypothetical protein [Solirubrobacterales bacterium]